MVNFLIDGICLVVMSMFSCSTTRLCSRCISCSLSSINCTAFDLWDVDFCIVLLETKDEKRAKSVYPMSDKQ